MVGLFAIVIGVMAGILSGLMGIGGGIIMIPAMIYLYGFNQHMAQGTTLAAMVFPIGIFAALEYYRNGYVNITVAVFIALGFLAGGYIGAKFAAGLGDMVLKKVFGIFLLILAMKMIFFE